MGHRYCIFGAGCRGITTIYNLIESCDADEILVHEPDQHVITSATEKLKILLGLNYCKISWTTSIDKPTIHEINWFMFDKMISCAPYGANLDLAEFADSWGVPFCISKGKA